jgi:hypothetical protein
VNDPVTSGRLWKSPYEDTPGTIRLPSRRLKLGSVKPGVVGADRLSGNGEDLGLSQGWRLSRGRRGGFGVARLVMAAPDHNPQSCNQEEQQFLHAGFDGSLPRMLPERPARLRRKPLA